MRLVLIALAHALHRTLTDWIRILEKHAREQAGGPDSDDSQLRQARARVERLVRSKGSTRIANAGAAGSTGGGAAVDEASPPRSGAPLPLSEAPLPLSEGVLASSQRLVQLFPLLENSPVHLAVPITIVGSNWCLPMPACLVVLSSCSLGLHHILALLVCCDIISHHIASILKISRASLVDVRA